MTRESKWTRLAIGALLALMAGALLAGCQSGRQEFRQELSAGVRALRAGELDDADGHIAEAGRKAKTFEQKRQVQSLANLSNGARAVMAGDATEATEQWSAIRDPQLNREVRVQAEQRDLLRRRLL